MDTPDRRSWQRLTLTLPPDASRALGSIAEANFRDRKREALRLILEGIEREQRPIAVRARGR